MKILIFIEGTILMHLSGKDVIREERVKQSQAAGIQREGRQIAYNANVSLPAAEKDSIYDFESYIPIGNAADKLNHWEKQGATIWYLTSRRIRNEIETIKKVLKRFNFPNASNLFFRQQGENYKDVAEKVVPDILIEDDCESIGGEVEMTYPRINKALKEKIKHIVVKEFEGIGNLPDTLEELKDFRYEKTY